MCECVQYTQHIVLCECIIYPVYAVSCRQFPGLPGLEFSAPAVLQDVTDTVSRLFNFVRTDPKVFPPMDRHFTAVYSRDREYL